MRVAPDPEELHIDAARRRNRRLVARRLGVCILCHAVWEEDVILPYIHMVKEILVHKAVIALRIALRQTDILVQIERRCLGEIQPHGLMQPNKILIELDRRTACGKPQYRVRFDPELPRKDLRRFLAHILIGVGINDTQCNSPFDKTRLKSTTI